MPTNYTDLQTLIDNSQIGLTLIQERRIAEQASMPTETVPDPVNIQQLTDTASAEVAQSRTAQREIAQKAVATSNSNDLLRDNIAKALDEQNKAANLRAKIAAETTVTASQLNSSAVSTYQQNVNSPVAQAKRQQLLKDLTLAQDNYRAAKEEVDGSNWFMAAVRRDTVLKPARTRLQQAQQSVQSQQAIVQGASTNFVNALKNNERIAGNLSAEEMAKATEQGQYASNMIATMEAKGKLNTGEIAEYAALMNMEEGLMRGAVLQLQTELSNQSLTEAKATTILQEVSAASAIFRLEKQMEASASAEDFYGEMDKKFNVVLESMGEGDSIGKLTYKNTVENNMNLTNKYFEEWVRHERDGVHNDKALAKAMTKKRMGNEAMTPTEDALIASSASLIKEHNDAIREKLNTVNDQATIDSLNSQILDPTDAEDTLAIANLYEDKKRRTKNNATSVLKSGILTVPDMKASIFTDPKTAGLFTPEIAKFVTSADIDLTLGGVTGAKPGEQIDVITEQTLDFIEKAMSSSTATNGTPDDATIVQETLLKNFSQGYGKYYTEAMKISTHAIGFNELKNPIIDGVTGSNSTGWISGTFDEKSLNVNSQGEWMIHLRDKLRARKARTARTKASSGISNNITTLN